MQAINRPFNQLINGSTQFFIPVFQRDFTWGEDQCRQFWQDIGRSSSNANSPSGHFLGSFVYVDSRDTTAGFTRWMVIDGQQRLTTLTILLEALRDVLVKLGPHGDPNNPKPEAIDGLFLKNPFETGDRQRKLVLRRTDDETLECLIEGRDLPAIPSERIVEAYELFIQLLEDANLDLVHKGIMGLVVVDVRLDPLSDNPQLVFESLNSTGVDLSQADHIRNFVRMSLAESEQNRMYEQYWRKIEVLFREAGPALDNFFRDFIALRTGATTQARNDQIYQTFKNWFSALESGSQDIELILGELLQAAQYYAAFRLGRGVEGKLSSALGQTRRLGDTPAILIMRLFASHRESQLFSERDFLQAIELVESYLLRRAICGLNTRGYWAIFAGLAKSLQKDASFQDLKVGFTRLPESYKFPSNKEFTDGLRAENVYRFQVCRPLLERLENAGTNELTDTSGYSIEHIMPQNKNLPYAWKAMLGDDWEDVHNRYLHSLGNLTLTGYNSTYSDRSFEEKKTISGGFNESAVRLNRYVREQSNWGAQEISQREDQLVEKALQIWSQPDVDANLVKQAQIQDLRTLSADGDPLEINMSETAKSLFEALRSEVIQLGPESEVIEIAREKTVTYYGPDFFLEIIPRRHRLDLLLSLDFGEVDDPSGIAEDRDQRNFVINATHHGGVVLFMSHLKDLESIIPLVKQSFRSVAVSAAY